MRRVLWNGSGSEQHNGQALVSWKVVRKPTQEGGLGILDIQKTNTALLTKWVARLISYGKGRATAKG